MAKSQKLPRYWRYQLGENFQYQSEHLGGVAFKNPWCEIQNNTIKISKGYAWDGCSPAWKVPFFKDLWVGTPDGKLGIDGRPQAFFASLVHDVLCQFHMEIPIKKSQTVKLFEEMLLKSGFSEPRAKIYAAAVNWFGPQRWGALAKLKEKEEAK